MGGNRASHAASARALSPVLSEKELTPVFEMLKTSAWEGEKGLT